MRNIIIVECMSTGVNFIQDIINNNCNPVVLETKLEDNNGMELYSNLRSSSYESISQDFELIKEKDSYPETLEMVKSYEPLIVIPGSEKGVRLATRLANDLKLKCNPIENIDAMTLKDKMHEKLKEHGLRYIKGKVVHSVKEAIEYYDKEELNKVVVKPTYSAGSVGVKICLDRQEMIKSIEELLDDVNVYGDKLTELVVQEYIDGEEYVVNTVSCNGHHRVTLIWKYYKEKTPEGGQIYDYVETINELGLGEADLVDYAYDVANAIGIRYGPIHGEYMIDEKGPVLIEVNCRPCGFNLDAEYLDRISGQHETDSVLDSYLNPPKFKFDSQNGYELYEHGAMKFFIVPKDIIAKSSPMSHIADNLKSHYTTSSDILIDEYKPFVKTQNLETTGGTVYLTHKDGYIVEKDIDFLRSVEKHAFQLILSDETHEKIALDEDESFENIKSLLEEITAFGQILLVSDRIFDDLNILQIEPEKSDEIKGEFDCVVINLSESLINKKDDEITYLFLEIMKKVKNGGFIFVPENTYKYFPNGRIGVETLIKVLDFKIALPMHKAKKILIGVRK